MEKETQERILRYIGDAIEVCEKETRDILGVTIELYNESGISDDYVWNGERFVLSKLGFCLKCDRL